MLKDILEARDCGLIRISSASKWYDNHQAAILELGFDIKLVDLHHIDKEIASKIVQSILWRDLAYDSEISTFDIARKKSEWIISELSDLTSQYYTNGIWEVKGDRMVLKSWTPLTDATFDSGIIIINQESAFTIWVEDED